MNRDSPEVPNVTRKDHLFSDRQESQAHLRITILLVTLVAALLWVRQFNSQYLLIIYNYFINQLIEFIILCFQSTVWLIWTFAVYGAITGTYMLVTILTIVIVHGQVRTYYVAGAILCVFTAV